MRERNPLENRGLSASYISYEAGNRVAPGTQHRVTRLPRGCPLVARPLNWGSRGAPGMWRKVGSRVAPGELTDAI